MAVVRASWPKSVLKSHVSRGAAIEEKISHCIQEINTSLLQVSSERKAVGVGWLIGLGNFCGLIACTSLVANKEEIKGWQEIGKSLTYSLSALKIQVGMGMPRCTVNDTATACSMFCVALLCGRVEVQDWLANVIVSSYQTGKGLTNFDQSPFSLVVLQLASQHLGVEIKSLPQAKEHAGFYQPLLTAQSVDEAQMAIDALAIERVKLVLETHSDYPPFEYAPFDLWPVDLMTIARERFPDQAFTFGVLESPLCHPPEPFPFSSDPLVDRVLARCRESMSISDVNW